MAKRRRIRWDRVILVFGPLLLLILLLCTHCGKKDDKEDSKAPAASSSEAEVTDITVPVSEQDQNPVVPAQAEARQLVVVIDAGHGGEDGGALDSDTNPTRFEKDDNLTLALKVRDALQKYPDVHVIMTRETDVFVELQTRCDIANQADADFFISLHRNSALSGSGVEIWINNDSNGQGDNSMDKMLAQYIMEWLDETGISKNRGIKTGFRNSSSNTESNNYYVNRYTTMPSCLIEMGFMTSEEDNENFDEKGDAYANAIASAIMELVTDRNLLADETTTTLPTETTTTTSTIAQ